MSTHSTTPPPRLRTPDDSSSSMRVWLYIGAALMGFAFLSFEDDSFGTLDATSADTAASISTAGPDAAAPAYTVITMPSAASTPRGRRSLAATRSAP